MKKIIILRLGAIGDVVYTTALVDALKNINPDVEIHYITSPLCSPIIRHHKNIDNVVALKNKSYSYLYKLGGFLRKNNYDLFINLQPSLRNRFLGKILQPKKTLNYKKTFKMHVTENFCLTAKAAFEDIKVPQSLSLTMLEKSFKNLPEIPENKKIIALNIGGSTSRQGRLWIPEYWGELAEMLHETFDCKLFVTGSFDDLSMSGHIKNAENMCGKLKLDETAALLSKCDLVISNDTGPLHISAAMNTPSIGIFGSTIYERARPYGNDKCYVVSTELDCASCNKRKCKLDSSTDFSPCMYNIKPKKIINFVKKVLA